MDEENPVELELKRFQELSGNEIFQIMKLRQDVFVVEQKAAYPDMDVFDQDSEHLWVSTSSGEIVGVTRLYQIKDNIWHIGRVAVKQEYRGKRLATQMMDFAKKYILANYQVDSIVLSAQTYLLHFYERFGFEKSSDIYIEDSIEHIDMTYYNVVHSTI